MDFWRVAARLRWDVRCLPATAWLDGMLVTGAEWRARVQDVDPVVFVGDHVVPIAWPDAANSYTIEELVRTVSVFMRRHRVRGSHVVVGDTLRHYLWRNVVRDAHEPRILRIVLA